MTERDDAGRLMVLLGARPGAFAPPRHLPPLGEDWRDAHPVRIAEALARVKTKPTGNWYVLGATADLGEQPACHVVDGRELVSWRAEGRVLCAPNGCPHMGAALSDGCVRAGRLVCPWHGLGLGPEGMGAWRPLPTHDDGVLTWVRLGPAERAAPTPILAPRPARHLSGVLTFFAKCDPDDVIANRLDPWHGTHLHGASFARLRVIANEPDVMKLRVAFRVKGPLCIEVDCTFHCPEPRTIVMTIVDGEGAGSVVETHATPVRPGVTKVVEATLATSPRPGFGYALPLQRLVRPFIQRAAQKLWDDDAPYAERTYALRTTGTPVEARAGQRAVRGTP